MNDNIATDFAPTRINAQDDSFTLDAQTLEQRKAARARQLNVIQIPLLRLAGFGLLSVAALLYDGLTYPAMPWRSWFELAAINLTYGLFAWLCLGLLYRRTGRLDLTLVFLHLDVLVWLLTLHHLKGSQTVLAMMLLARVGDSIGYSFRRAIYFTHYVLAIYLGYVAWLHHIEPDSALLAERLGAAGALYTLGLYISLTARSVTRLRERTANAVRQARDLLALLNKKTHTLEQQASELVTARDAAESANRTKSAFLATMSHEIRTPMNGILGIAQLLQAPELNDQERIEHARIILDAGQALQTLLNDILDLSKVEAGKLTLEFSPVRPALIVQEELVLFSASAGQKGLALRMNCLLPEQQHYRCDAHRLRQMLSNLIANAIKFTERGEVNVETREVARDIGVAMLEFSVRDTGIGIPPAKLALLFQPFSQADSSTTRQFGGTGLGLFIVRNLAQLMDGEAGAESTPGQGSRFWFRIRAEMVEAPATPLVAEQAATRNRTASAEAPTHRQGQVLVVEDNAVNRKIAQLMLTRLGLNVSLAEDGQQAVDLITQGKHYDLVLMDMQMPVMDGLTAARHIRSWEERSARKRLPIVALTANAYTEDRKQCEDAGMDDFLSKPLHLLALQQIAERYLGSSLS